MCGISGFYYHDREVTADKNIALSMSEAIRHRGPDEESNYTRSNCSLSSNRLAIIDPLMGKQPCFSESRRIVSVFNGEIYNHRELRSWLFSRGHKLNSNSDSEIIPHLYEEHNDDFVTKLRGMFSIALLDETNNRLILARDRIGIKPLYYYADGKCTAFGSEIKSLTKFPGIATECDTSSLVDYFSAGYILTPKTIFTSVKSVPPAHLLIADENGISLRKYWDLNDVQPSQLTAKDSEDTLVEMLDEAVKLHMQSDVPFGAFLSGGLDSSLVVSLMSKKSNEPVNTFTADLWYCNKAEITSSQSVNSIYNTSSQKIVLDKNIISEIPSIISCMDEPFADSSLIPAFLISRETAKKVKVALSGDGGDENFAGYPSYKADMVRSLLQNNFFLKYLLPFSRIAGQTLSKIAITDKRLDRFFSGLTMDAPQAHYHWRTVFSQQELNELLKKDFMETTRGYKTEDLFVKYYGETGTGDFLNRMMQLDIKTWLADDILKKVDMASMANSLEVRVPFLDHKIVEFAASLSSSCKLKGLNGKLILKKAAGRFLPKNVINMKKSGFNMPLRNLLKNDLKDLIYSVVFNSDARKDSIINSEYSKKLFEEHMKGLKDNSQKLWTLFCYYLWRNR